MLIRGMRLDGLIFPLNVTLKAEFGEELDVDATVFVPDSEYLWGDFPSFIGLGGFLERIRFAIDPNMDTFYFGQLWNMGTWSVGRSHPESRLRNALHHKKNTEYSYASL